MAQPCSTPRQLAPTVGHSTSARIIFRTGLPLVAGLILIFGDFDCVIDNAACFAGNIRIYITTIVEVFPSVVTSIIDVPLRRLACGPTVTNGCVEVMVVNSRENHRPPQERRAGGESSTLQQEQDPLTASIQHLGTPVIIEADPAAAAAVLEATRQKLLEEANKVAANQRRLNATVHEYNAAHGFVRQVQHQGHDLAPPTHAQAQHNPFTALPPRT